MPLDSVFFSTLHARRALLRDTDAFILAHFFSSPSRDAFSLTTHLFVGGALHTRGTTVHVTKQNTKINSVAAGGLLLLLLLWLE